MQRNQLDDGALVVDGIVIGNVTGIADEGPECPDPVAPVDRDLDQRPTVTLNLGWAKAAGVHVVVLADPDVDRNRGGIVLDR